MRSKVNSFLAFALIFLLMGGNGAYACSWAAFANGEVAIVARTMDWYYDDHAVVKGHGRNVRVKAAEGPDGLEYAAKYASIQIHSFDIGLVIEAMNEKGLQGAILFLDNSEMPAPRPGRKDISPNNFIAYAVSSFSTVQEVVENLDKINMIADSINIPGPGGHGIGYSPKHWPGHFALADASGDKVVIELLKGEVVVHHGKEHDAITNEPPYDIHLALDAIKYQPNGTISTVDRRARAKQYLQSMYARGVATSARALVAMRGLLASVHAGSELTDPMTGEVYPTIWAALADQKSGRYYLSRYASWCAEQYDFSLFDPAKPEVAPLKAAPSPYENIHMEGGALGAVSK